MFKSNSHLEYSQRVPQRRRGQALLLAVLVMVFVSIIGATFITVVAINIGQTNRSEEKDKARQAAQAGLAFANLQLTESIQGMKWRPEQEVKFGNGATDFGPPNAANAFYWTPFDTAQSWAGNNGLAEGNFVKFPDPRSTNPSFDAPNYMVKVEKVAPNDPIDNTNNDKTGALRITTIGLSPDDPATFHKTVAYKAGPMQQPLIGAMRSVTNWDFQNEVVPSATTANSGSTNPTATADITLKNPIGSMANKKNFYVIISSATGGNVRYAVVAEALNSTTLRLAPAPPTPTIQASPAPPAIGWVADERVELAAGLGAPAALDFNNNVAADATAERVDFNISKVAMPGSVKVNGGLALLGNTFLQNLRDPRQAAAGAPAGSIEASGLISVNTANVSTVAGTLENGTATGDRTLLNSSDGNFPFAGTGTLEQKRRLVQDGLNRINNSPDSTRQVKPFTPANITSGGQGFGRYRQMTKYSQPAVSGNPPQASAYGYGEGIYINNPQDKERSALNSEMTQAQLQSLWFDSAGTTNNFLRAGTPLAATVATASLEQQHLRGWIAPDEFLPRGVLIEITPDAKLTITLDSITDGAGNTAGGERFNEGPVPDKSWRDVNGTFIGSPTLGGVYRRAKIDWPKNGVIFAEGNIRIRGKATTNNPALNLTVVSMNNIYIEDSLKAGNKKILLLARRNVVVNPTRVVGRPQAQTRAVAGGASTTLNVRDGSLFSIGDRIRIGGATTYRRVNNVVGNTLTLSSAPGGAPTDATVVALQTDPDNDANSLPFYNLQTPYLKAETAAAQRRFWLEGNPGAVRVAMRHGGAERMALSVGLTGTDPGNLKLGNKLAAPPNSGPAPLQISSLEKILTVEGDTGASFPSAPADPDPTNTINALITQMNDRYDTLKVNPDPWEYNASAVAGYGTVPYRYLAGVGLRHKFFAAAPPSVPTFPFRELLTGTAKEFPMATSVKLLINGNDGALDTETGTGVYSTVNQFGFNPNFANLEDALTVDRSFYNTFTNSSGGTVPLFERLTTDSRRIANNLRSDALNTLTWRFHDDAIAAFSASASPSRPLPFYAVDRAKIENLAQYRTDTYAFETLDAGYTLDINAYVYAQEGSWFVIPGVYFDDRLKTNATGPYMDYDNDNIPDAGEYLDTTDPGNFNAGEGPDLNRDGVYSRAEQLSVYRFLRHNYKINFTGAIMENNTALVEDPDGTGVQRGPVADWTDKWATVKTKANNFSGTSIASTLTPATMTTANENFSTIEYNFDPQAALETLVTTDGFHPPISPELLYQTG